MKIFLVFSGLKYYPQGGMNDYQGSFDSVEEAKNFIKTAKEKNCWGWHQVFNKETGITLVNES